MNIKKVLDSLDGMVIDGTVIKMRDGTNDEFWNMTGADGKTVTMKNPFFGLKKMKNAEEIDINNLHYDYD